MRKFKTSIEESVKKYVKSSIGQDEILIRIDAECQEAQKELNNLWIDKFDKYACIKNDKWYLEWKENIK